MLPRSEKVRSLDCILDYIICYFYAMVFLKLAHARINAIAFILAGIARFMTAYTCYKQRDIVLITI